MSIQTNQPTDKLTPSTGTLTIDGILSVTGNVTANNLSGTNTGDQTITLTGDVTGSGTGSFATTLSTTAVTPGSYTAANITVGPDGRITAASSTSLATVATSGAYSDLSGTPTIPTKTSDLTNDSGFIDTAGARSAISASGDLSYNSTTGVISYTTPTIDALLPSQTGNSGKFLTTNGTSVSWATVTASASLTSSYQSGSSGVKTDTSWYTVTSASLAAGTWLLVGQVKCSESSNSSTSFSTRFFDGTTAYGTVDSGQSIASTSIVIPTNYIITLASTTTISIQYQRGVGSFNNSSATGFFSAVKIA